MIKKEYYENVIEEILEIIKTNTIMLYNWDDRMLELKKYCKDKNDEKYKKMDYWDLIYLVEETLTELINTDYLYDFRELDYK